MIYNIKRFAADEKQPLEPRIMGTAYKFQIV